jgi:hypothetical protein
MLAMLQMQNIHNKPLTLNSLRTAAASYQPFPIDCAFSAFQNPMTQQAALSKIRFPVMVKVSYS